MAAGRVIDAIAARNAELAATEHPWVGAETYFLGEVHGGDFYNRFPTECRLVGTRRWAPGNTLEAVEAEFRELLAPHRRRDGMLDRARPEARPRRLLDRSRARARAGVRAGYEDVTGTELPLTGIKVVADGAVFQGEAAIPTVYHGPAGTRRPRRRRVHARRASSSARRRSIWRCSSTCGRREPALPSYEELRRRFAGSCPPSSTSASRSRPPAARPRPRSSSRTAARSPARSASAS